MQGIRGGFQAAKDKAAAAAAAVTAGKDAVVAGKDAVADKITAGQAASGEWVHRALVALPAPAAPAAEQWEFSLGALITTHPRVPAVTAKPLRLLDGMGALRFGPESVGFDGEDIPWEKVRAIRLH
ncbi:hypothetical protein P8605_40270, partial [Streptomyces sp. T-3]|nr:hypothetical protein [Streptomyces sp. T-3]